GQPLRTLLGHSDKVWSVAFSPDGTRLISGSSDQTVRLWDARPLTSKIQVEREAAALLDVYRADGLTQAEAALRLRDQVGISAEVQELAQSFLHRAADDAQRFNSAAWRLVHERDAPAVQYESALRQAQTAVRLMPDDGYVRNTLGVAQYRCGQYLEALANLQRAYDLNLLRGRRSMQLDIGRLLMSPWLLPATNLASYEHPADLAFLAMTHCRIGHDDEARDWLSRLRIIIQQRRWAEDEEVQSFLREAEAVCAGLNQRQ